MALYSRRRRIKWLRRHMYVFVELGGVVIDDIFGEEIWIMKIWIDDVRPAPDGYVLFQTVNDALRYIRLHSEFIDVIDLDHDAGTCAAEGGDYINILNELERLSHRPTYEGYYWDSWLKNQVMFHFHSANPVGVQNMRRIIEKNGWKEIRS